MTSVGPPELPGYQYEADLGRGGFADVYRYRQFRPERQVAIKVLREATQSPADAERFENEINRMSQLSSHPSILTIFEVGVAPDGRPFFTMEYCPHDHFGQIAKNEPLPVARALEVGIKISGAVDTAHAAGILHRDIKPANILLTAYGEPSLTDFGIAGGRDAEVVAEAEGVTIPFAPPEVVSGRSYGDEMADVYSLGATIYALLAGRAPFSTGGRITQAELINRIIAGSPPPTGRPDVPPELEHLLATAMAVEPGNRYTSAAALGRALQTVEARLYLPQTPLRVSPSRSTPRPGPARAWTEDDDDEDSTRFKTPSRVDPNQVPARARRSDPDPDTSPRTPAPIHQVPVVAGTVAPSRPTVPRRSGDDLPVPDALDAPTEHRDRVAAPPPPDFEDADQRDGLNRMALLASVAAAMLLAIGLGYVLVVTGDSDAGPPTTTMVRTTTTDLVVAPPLPPEDVRITVDPNTSAPTVVWTTAPDTTEDDRYRIEVTRGPRAGFSEEARQPEYRFPDRLSELCVRVYVIRGSHVSPPAPEACQP